MKLEKRNGIHIPQEIFSLTDIDWTAKVLLSEIYHFNKKKTCFASNRHFAELLQITGGAASKQIKKLKKLNYISTSIIYENGKTVGRIIKYLGKSDTIDAVNNNPKTSAKKEKQPDKSGTADSNPTTSSWKHTDVPEQPEVTSSTTKGVLPEQSEGSSSRTSGVLPERLEGTSSGNTNNTINKTNKNNTDNKALEIDQLISNVDELIEHSSFINQLFFNKPALLDEFKKAFLNYSNNEKYPMDQLLSDMKYVFEDYPNWKNDLLQLGYDRFMHTIEPYHGGTPPEVAGLIASSLRIILQHRTE